MKVLKRHLNSMGDDMAGGLLPGAWSEPSANDYGELLNSCHWHPEANSMRGASKSGKSPC